MSFDQLPLFEQNRPEQSRLTISGSTVGEDLGGWKLDEPATFIVRGVITKVNHVRMKDGTLERQHVFVADSIVTDEGTIMPSGGGDG